MSAVDNLTRQILAQGTSGRWTGQGFGGAEANARAMAEMLAGAGITDIRDFGRIKVPTIERVNVQPEVELHFNYSTPDTWGQPPTQVPTGRYFYTDSSGKQVFVDPSSVKTEERTEGYWGADSAPQTVKYQYADVKVGEKEAFGNKKTGQEVNPNYNRAGGDVFGGTYAGHGRTNFGVQFGPDGTPYFYTQFGGDTSSMKDIVPVVSLGLALFAPGIGSAIGSALTGTAATTLASQVVGAAIVQGVLAEAQGGEFIDGAIRGAVTAGVAPVVAESVGSTVAGLMEDSAFRSVVSNTVASSASSAVTAALTGGDVESAALTGALGGAGGSIGRELGTALEYSTDPLSQQTQMLAAQEQGLGTAGGSGANVGAAFGSIAAGTDPTSAAINALIKTTVEQRAAEATPVSSTVGGQVAAAQPPEETVAQAPEAAAPQAQDEQLAQLLAGSENIGQMFTGQPGEIFAGPSGITARYVEAMPQMQPRANEIAGPVEEYLQDDGTTTYYRTITQNRPNGEVFTYEVSYDPSAENSSRGPISYRWSEKSTDPNVAATLFESPNPPAEFRPEEDVSPSAQDQSSISPESQLGFILEQPFSPVGISPAPSTAPSSTPTPAFDFAPSPAPATAPSPAPAAAPAPVADAFTPPSTAIRDFFALPSVTPTLSSVLNTTGIFGPVSTPVSAPSEGVFGPSEAQSVPFFPEIPVGTGGQPSVDLLPPSTQEISIPDQISQVLDGLVGGGGVGPGEVAGEVVTSPEVAPDVGAEIVDVPTEVQAPVDVGPPVDTGEAVDVEVPEEVVDVEVPEEVVDVFEPEPEVETETVTTETAQQPPPVSEPIQRPFIRDYFISSGRRRDFGPTVTTLGQALQAPVFPTSPVSGLTSYRGAGEIEGQTTGKPRRNVWNESSLRLKDALGL